MPYASGETPQVGDYVKNEFEQPGTVNSSLQTDCCMTARGARLEAREINVNSTAGVSGKSRPPSSHLISFAPCRFLRNLDFSLSGMSPRFRLTSRRALSWQMYYPSPPSSPGSRARAMPCFVFGVNHAEPLSANATVASSGSFTRTAPRRQCLANPFEVLGFRPILLLLHGRPSC